jgi:hypothetical protein
VNREYYETARHFSSFKITFPSESNLDSGKRKEEYLAGFAIIN